MNWLSGGKSGSQAASSPNTGGSVGNDQEQQMRMLSELEIELTADMYQRLVIRIIVLSSPQILPFEFQHSTG